MKNNSDLFTFLKYLRSFSLLGLISLELRDNKVNGVKNILIQFSVTILLKYFILVLFDSSANQGLNCLLCHSKCFVESIIITFLIVRSHLLFLNISLNIFLLQLIDYFLFLQSLLVFCHLF